LKIETLKRFLNPLDDRPYMRELCILNGTLVSGDGHIAIFSSVEEIADSVSPPPTLLAMNLYKWQDKVKEADFSDALSVTDVKVPVLVDCSMCKGKGRVTECAECDGEGVFVHRNHEYECKECDGTGRAASAHDGFDCACPSCRGDGKQHIFVKLHFFNDVCVGIKSRHLLLLQKYVPDARLVPIEENKVAFRGSDAFGVIMGVGL
jgi:hypothetical protein